MPKLFYTVSRTKLDVAGHSHLRAINTLETQERAKNWRLSLCQVCQGEIFYLDLPDEARRWWHEESEQDALHPAMPEKGGKL